MSIARSLRGRREVALCLSIFQVVAAIGCSAGVASEAGAGGSAVHGTGGGAGKGGNVGSGGSVNSGGATGSGGQATGGQATGGQASTGGAAPTNGGATGIAGKGGGPSVGNGGLTGAGGTVQNGGRGGAGGIAGNNPGGSGVVNWGAEEDPSSKCTLTGTLPEYADLKADSKLPDPFKMLDGTRITNNAQWACRRAEILKQLFKYVYGEKPIPAKGSVSGTVSSSKISVKVSEGGAVHSMPPSI